jgi:predicted nucleotidyltransferase
MAAPLQTALAPFADRITAAFVYGSIAKGTDTAQSDIDIMIIGDGLDYPELYTALQGAEKVLHRPVNPTIYSMKEFRKRKRAGNSFLERVLAQPRLWVIGSDDAIE